MCATAYMKLTDRSNKSHEPTLTKEVASNPPTHRQAHRHMYKYVYTYIVLWT